MWQWECVKKPSTEIRGLIALSVRDGMLTVKGSHICVYLYPEITLGSVKSERIPHSSRLVAIQTKFKPNSNYRCSWQSRAYRLRVGLVLCKRDHISITNDLKDFPLVYFLKYLVYNFHMLCM